MINVTSKSRFKKLTLDEQRDLARSDYNAYIEYLQSYCDHAVVEIHQTAVSGAIRRTLRWSTTFDLLWMAFLVWRGGTVRDIFICLAAYWWFQGAEWAYRRWIKPKKNTDDPLDEPELDA